MYRRYPFKLLIPPSPKRLNRFFIVWSLLCTRLLKWKHFDVISALLKFACHNEFAKTISYLIRYRLRPDLTDAEIWKWGSSYPSKNINYENKNDRQIQLSNMFIIFRQIKCRDSDISKRVSNRHFKLWEYY